MTTKIRDLTIQEFKDLLSSVVKETFEELLEDFTALSSNDFLESIEEARINFKEGKVKSFEEAFYV